MTRTVCRSVLTSVTAAMVVGFVTTGPRMARLMGQTTSGQPSTAKGDWPYYTADTRGSRYSPLDQVNATNFNQLEVAWRFKTDNLGTRPEYKLEGTPLAINGFLYATHGTPLPILPPPPKARALICCRTCH